LLQLQFSLARTKRRRILRTRTDPIEFIEFEQCKDLKYYKGEFCTNTIGYIILVKLPDSKPVFQEKCETFCNKCKTDSHITKHADKS
jgi:hypothetical protein